MDSQAHPVSASEKFPAEIWLDIFERVPKSTDLHSVSVACRLFRDLTTRALHRDLVWTNPNHVLHNFDVWSANQGMESHVRSLVLGVCTPPPQASTRAMDIDGNIVHVGTYYNAWQRRGERGVANRYALEYSDELYATDRLHDAMWERIQSFKNIRSLTITNIHANHGHFLLIHDLPQLRSLSLVGCIFHGSAARGMSHLALPITDLTLLNVRRGSGSSPHEFHHMNAAQFQHMHQQFQNAILPHMPHAPVDPVAAVLSLSTAQNLRTLTVDSSADVFRLVFNSPEAQHRGWEIPPTLESVYVVRKRTCAGGEPKQSLYSGESTFPDTHLYHFCAQASSLKTISTPIFVPSQVTIAAEVLPANLERFCAPVETSQLVATVRDVKALGLLKCGVGAREGVTALTSIAVMRPGLKMLMLESKGWDGEIVSAVAQHFQELRRLKIVYEGAGPTEDYLVSVAPDYLWMMSELHTLEMYELPGNGGFKPSYPRFLHDETFDSIEEELRDIIIPWNRFCPKLRKVQLLSGYVMTRGFEGDVWKLEKVNRLDDREDLDY